ncbi:hypothetical protein [Wolbachia endosymbiont of Glossina morsitans morsitans]|uniref:hypothetical protein n=1 Tax=Wolbachia endosymbiont of Glossina morsitans morsitans TaxID=1150948 RepID=UPI001F119DA4|nr:hypothetical protein [Wolbachia endosymbiont of Glossina morsitans morsitans]
MSIVSSQNSLLSSQCVTHDCTNIVFASRCGVIPVLRHWDPAFVILLLVCAFMENVKIICRQSLLDPNVSYLHDKKGESFFKSSCKEK